MLNNLKEKSMIACGCIVIFMMIVVLFGNDKPIKIEKPKVDKEKIIELFNNIDNNYTLNIEENINNTITKYIYYIDSDIEFYEKENNDIGYINYKNKKYSVNGNNYTINEIDNFEFINSEYYDIKFIKQVIDKCEFEYVNAQNVKCKINRNDYYQKYNEVYNESYGNNGDDEIEIHITYYNNIQNIKIDYSLNNEIKIYNLKLSNINSTDFSFIKDNYKDVLN